MEQVIETHKTNGATNGRSIKKSQPKKAGSVKQKHHSTFDPMKYMLKLPKTKKVKLSNRQIKWEQIEADYLPVAARIMWFRREHSDWSIITKVVQLANKAVVMKAIIKNAEGRIIATARKKRNRSRPSRLHREGRNRSDWPSPCLVRIRNIASARI